MAIPVQEVETRFLYPFLFDQRWINEAAESLIGLTSKGERHIWKCAAPHELYLQELMSNVSGFLFSGEQHRGCRFFEIDWVALNSWFRNGIPMSTSKGEPLDTAVTCCKIELFLSPHGSGVLSITLKPSLSAKPPKALDASHVKDFNYHGSQLRNKIMPRLSIPYPENMPTGQLPPRPGTDAPLSERLGATGGFFSLGSLCEFLLQPLAPRTVQNQFSVYSVIRLDQSVSFDSEDTRRELAPVLAGLAQIEEKLHAGAPKGEINVPNRILNSKHWAAVGSLGAAHLIADQGVPFDSQRVRVALDKYFIPYLAAFLQRLTTHRIIRDAQQTVLSLQDPGDLTTRSAEPRMSDLRLEMLRFVLCSNFTEISSREALNRYYDLSREGLRVAASLAVAKEAIVDFDAAESARRGQEMNESLGRNVETVTAISEQLNQNVQTVAVMSGDLDRNIKIVAAVQTKVEWLEVFFVSFYAAELSELVAESQDFGHAYLAWTVPAWAIFAGLVAALCLRPWQHSASENHERWRLPSVRSLLAATLVVAIIWFVAGLLGRPTRTSSSPSAAHDQLPSEHSGTEQSLP